MRGKTWKIPGKCLENTWKIFGNTWKIPGKYLENTGEYLENTGEYLENIGITFIESGLPSWDPWDPWVPWGPMGPGSFCVFLFVCNRVEHNKQLLNHLIILLNYLHHLKK